MNRSLADPARGVKIHRKNAQKEPQKEPQK
jgi:hypothetical protein